MKKNYIFTFFFLTLSFHMFSQSQVSGVVTDAETGEELIGVNIISAHQGTTSEYDGSYTLDLPAGEHEITFSYVGFQTYVEKVNIGTQPVRLDLKMKAGEILSEVFVTADIAIQRKTPVAFSNIPTLKLQEELAAQDIPMILNSTPGAYATTSGGGDGDARITIRGFNQRNVAVMLDGIPVNDMENGWVYWSNWFGLDLVTKTMQVQRGLGASKLAIPSVGGTINILTKGIDAKRSGRVRQEFGNDGYLRTTFGLTSGRLKNGWGVSLAGSYKQGDGYVDGTFTKGYFYYLRLDKQVGKHLFSFSGFGAPQKHGQRPFKKAIALFDTDVAMDLDIPQENIDKTIPRNRGIRFNEYSSVLNGEEINTNYNFYHKPQLSFRHSVQATEKLFFSNVAYLSIGKGGGAYLDGPALKFDTLSGNLFVQTAYDKNQDTTGFAKEDMRSENIVQASMNDHFWYGLLSTTQYTINENFSLSGGLDLRSYEGGHYRRIDDLFGGTYYWNTRNLRIDPLTKLKEKDKMDYDNKGFVRWGGLFGLLEFEKGRWSTFLNLSGSIISYKLEDYMKAKTFTIGEEEYFVSYNTADQGILPKGPVIIDGTIYTVDEPAENTISYAEDNGLIIDSNTPQNQTIDWVTYSGFTFKTGAAYKLNDKMSVFANLGVLSKAQSYTNVIRDNRNDEDMSPQLWGNIKNEKVYATELGYNFKSSNFSANLNTYFTIWENKPVSGVFDTNPDDPLETIPVNVNGMGARHMGVELDFAWELNKQFKVEGLASVADWIWNKDASYESQFTDTRNFYPKGVHVGDAAQLQFGGLVRYEPIKRLYFSLRGTFFGKNFSSFNPESLQVEQNRGKDSWKMPNYFLVNLNSGYSIKVKGMRIGLRFNVINLLDVDYIADATNNDTRAGIPLQQSTFDAKSASVYFGQGRRWSTGLSINF